MTVYFRFFKIEIFGAKIFFYKHTGGHSLIFRFGWCGVEFYFAKKNHLGLIGGCSNAGFKKLMALA